MKNNVLSPFPGNSADTALDRFLRLGEALHACSDEELEQQLQRLGFEEPKWVVPVVRVLLQSSLSLRQRQPLGMASVSQPTVSLIDTLSK